VCWRRIRKASTILTATSGVSFVTKCGLACLLSCHTDASHAQTDELHILVNTAVQVAAVAERDLDRRFAHLSHTLHARTYAAQDQPRNLGPRLDLPQRPADPSESRDLLRALARVDAARPTAQVGVVASRVVREVLRAQDTPVSERRITPIAPPTPRTPRCPGTPGRGR
jgi:hypothetical protein